MLNLPWQGKKLRSRDKARPGIWEPKPYMSDLSVWSRAVLRWIHQLLLTSYECWISSRNFWCRSTLGRRNSHAERMEVNMLHDRFLFVWAVPGDAVGDRQSPSSPQRQMAHHIPPAWVYKFSYWSSPDSIQTPLSETWGSHTCIKSLQWNNDPLWLKQ